MSTEALQLQVWILGGTTSLLLVAILALLKANMADIKKMLDDHEERIRKVEDHKIEMQGLVERHEEDIKEHKQLMAQLSSNVNRLSRL